MQGEATINRNSLLEIVEAIFACGTPEVCDAYSEFSKEITYFQNHQSLLAYIHERIEKEKHLGFAVFYPETEGFVKKRKIILDPKKCEGHTFRYAVNGWGVIQVQLEFRKTTDIKGRFAVNSVLRANKWFGTYPELKSPSLWRWKLIEKHARRLVRELKKHAQQIARPDSENNAAR